MLVGGGHVFCFLYSSNSCQYFINSNDNQVVIETGIHSSTETVMGYTDGRPAWSEALTASHNGALGDKCHLVEAVHEGSQPQIKTSLSAVTGFVTFPTYFDLLKDDFRKTMNRGEAKKKSGDWIYYEGISFFSFQSQVWIYIYFNINKNKQVPKSHQHLLIRIYIMI